VNDTTDLIRQIKIGGAYDKRHPDPKKNYGIGSMTLRFLLSGPNGGAQFVVYTGMHLPHVAEELWATPRSEHYNPFEPMGVDIGYHDYRPHYEGQKSLECDLLPGGRCFYDGTGLGASDFLPTFLAGGDEVVWPMLVERYTSLLGPKVVK